MSSPRVMHAPRGSQLTCRSWQTEAVYRMLQNNLDPEVAEKPDDLVVYGGYVLVLVFWFLLFRTKVGVHLRAVGENAAAADAMGVNVAATRYFWTIVGGALAGADGAYITCSIHPYWLNGITSGKGWIAVALVVFAMWHPLNALLGSFLFGSIEALQLQLQGRGDLYQ